MANRKFRDLTSAGTLSLTGGELFALGRHSGEAPSSHLSLNDLNAYLGGGDALTALEDMQEPTGFPNSDDVLVSINEGTTTVTLTPAVTDYFFYSRAEKFTYSTVKDIIFTDVEGYHAIYYDTAGVLQELVNPSITLIENLIRLDCYVANIYWDATNKKAIYWTGQNELHGLQMDGATHSNQHFTIGTKYLNGAALNTFSVDDVTPTDASAQFGADIGFGLDEDRAFTGLAVLPTTGMPIYYLDGAAGNMRRQYNAGFSILTGGTGLPVFNEFTGGSYQLTEMTSGNYMWLYIFLTNNSPQGYVCFLGSAEYVQLQVARDAVSDDLSVVLSRNGITENKIIGAVLIEGKSSFTNAVKARVVSTNKGDYEDYRFEDITSILSPVDHGALAGLGEANDHLWAVKANVATSRVSAIGGCLKFEDLLGTTAPISGQISYGINAGTHVNLGIDSVTGTSGQDQSYCSVLYGNNCEARSAGATAGGDTCIATDGGIALGYKCEAYGNYSVAIGDTCISDGDGSVVMGDTCSIVTDADHSSILGGDTNTITDAAAKWSVICGGDHNVIARPYCFIGGGLENEIPDPTQGASSVICGGGQNKITGEGSVVIGGYNNYIDSIESFAGGAFMHLTSTAARSFVWGRKDAVPRQILTIPDRFSVFPGKVEGHLAVGMADIATVYKTHINAAQEEILALDESTNDVGLTVTGEPGETVISSFSAIQSTYSNLRLTSGAAEISLYSASNKITFGSGALVGIGTEIPSSVLDVVSTTSGLKPPSMTTAQRTAYAFPGAERSLVYDSDIKAHFVGNDSAWLQLGSGGGSGTYGEMGWVDNSSSVAANPNPVKAAGTSTAGALNDFTHTNGRLTYTGSETRLFGIAASFSWETASGVQDLASAFIYKNGVKISKSEITATIEPEATNRMPQALSINILEPLAKNDYIEFYVLNLDDSDPIKIRDLQFVVTETAGGQVTATTAIKAGISKNSNQSIGNAVNTAVTGWDATEFSNGITVDLPGGVLTAVTDGLYQISGSVYFLAGGSTGIRAVIFRKNAVATDYGLASLSSGTTNHVTLNPGTFLQLVAGDFVRMQVYQESGGVLGISGASAIQRCEFQMVRIGG